MSATVVPSRAPHRPRNTHQIHLVQSNLYPMPRQNRQKPSLLQRRVLKPLLEVLSVGCSPQRLAWSVAVGLALGLNPLIGSATVVSLLAAAVFRLNLVASQIATHIVYPIEVAMFFLFIRLGDRIFHTGHLPLHRDALLSAFRHHPLDTAKLLWTWEWHALTVWGVAAALFTPLLAALLVPVFQRMHTTSAAPVLVKG